MSSATAIWEAYTDSAIQIQKLVKIYEGRQKVTAVDAIDLKVSHGEIFGLLGPNGAGKTTTIGCCTTRTVPTSGRIWINGVEVQEDPPQARLLIGVVPQQNTLDRACTAWENIYFHCRYFGMAAETARRRSDDLLREFKLFERGSALVRELSGGMAQRLQIARAVAHQPKVLFLDEPTAGLDPQSRLAVWELVRNMRVSGITVLLTTHYMEEADQLCDRVAIIDHGRILVNGTPAELKQSVGAQTVMEMHLSDAPASLAEGLRSLPGVEAVEQTPPGFRVYARSRDGLLPRVVEVAQGYDLRDVAVTEPTLETVFIRLTGRELRD
ncbi:MAG TPA: ATP-binding cassette domain-containing protein [Terriglobales bacterium]|nr:ATP-binding cassette domain-containing protein [Terriglobales bacterium]